MPMRIIRARRADGQFFAHFSVIMGTIAEQYGKKGQMQPGRVFACVARELSPDWTAADRTQDKSTLGSE